MEILLKAVNSWQDLIPLLVMLFVGHRQAMAKIDKLTDNVTDLLTTAVEHSGKLENGTDRMDKIEAENTYLRKRCHDLSNNIHAIRNQMVTFKQLQELLDK